MAAEKKNKPIDISFTDITPKNVEQLRKLNLAIFPVRYNDKFYSLDVLKPEHSDITKLGWAFHSPFSIQSHLFQSIP
jgi:hypothetical protein